MISSSEGVLSTLWGGVKREVCKDINMDNTIRVSVGVAMSEGPVIRYIPSLTMGLQYLLYR